MTSIQRLGTPLVASFTQQPRTSSRLCDNLFGPPSATLSQRHLSILCLLSSFIRCELMLKDAFALASSQMKVGVLFYSFAPTSRTKSSNTLIKRTCYRQKTFKQCAVKTYAVMTLHNFVYRLLSVNEHGFLGKLIPGWKFRVFLLLYWTSTKARVYSLLCYFTPQLLGRKDVFIHSPKKICAKIRLNMNSI